MVAQTLIYFDDRFSNTILNQLISAATWWTRVRRRPMARRDPGRPCFPPMAPKRVNNKYPRSIVEARVFTVPVSNLVGTYLTYDEERSEIFARKHSRISATVCRRESRARTRRFESARFLPVVVVVHRCRPSHLSLERRAFPPCGRMRRGLRDDRSHTRACERARVRTCVRDISLEYARIYLPTLWNADELAVCLRWHSRCGHATTHRWVWVLFSFLFFSHSFFLFSVSACLIACVCVRICVWWDLRLECGSERCQVHITYIGRRAPT